MTLEVFLNAYLMSMCIYKCLLVCTCTIYTMHVSGVLRGQKRVSDALELELQAV